MLIRYNTEKLKSVIDDYANVAGISISVLNTEFHTLVVSSRPIPLFCSEIQRYPEGKERCIASDRALLQRCRETGQFEAHTCHAGITDAVYPIVKGGVILGYIMLGRMRNTQSFHDISCRLAWLPLNVGEMEEKYSELEYFDEYRVQSIANLAAIIAAYIITDNMINSEYDELVRTAVEYIERHLHEDLSAGTLCRVLHISKSSLYTRFRMALNCTVNEYVTAKRIEKAKQLLSDTALSVGAVSEAIGIQDTTYFCKLLKKETTLSPLQYRKKHNKNKRWYRNEKETEDHGLE